jgi:hypothetical protein
MFADMKTVRVGDIVFVHAGQKIYGAFEAATEFYEDHKTPMNFLSKNIHYNPDPTKPKGGWRDNVKKAVNLGYCLRLAITHHSDKRGRNMCFERGIDSNEVFELKSKGVIWSIPERWKYGDTSRTVRPLMRDEAFELLKILDRVNADNPDRLTVGPASLTNYVPIEFVLNPDIITNEKIIEGWLLENIGKHSGLDNALGPLTSFGNNMPAGYLKFMDIFGYQELATGIKKYKVIEIKKESCIFPDDINQLLGYTDWVVQNVAEGNYKLVEGILIAKNFNDDCKRFVENFNATARKIRLISFSYAFPGYNALEIKRVV